MASKDKSILSESVMLSNRFEMEPRLLPNEDAMSPNVPPESCRMVFRDDATSLRVSRGLTPTTSSTNLASNTIPGPSLMSTAMSKEKPWGAVFAGSNDGNRVCNKRTA